MASRKMKSTKAYKLKQSTAHTKLKQTMSATMRIFLVVTLAALLLKATSLVAIRRGRVKRAATAIAHTKGAKAAVPALPSATIVQKTASTMPPGAPTPLPELGRFEPHQGAGVSGNQLGGAELNQVKVRRKDGTVYHHTQPNKENLRGKANQNP
jgi:hypothetical protein